MRLRSLPLSSILLLLGGLACRPSPAQAPAKKPAPAPPSVPAGPLTLVVTGASGAQLLAVGCSAKPEGGLARRIAALKAAPAGALRLDTGNQFFSSVNIKAEQQAAARSKAALIAGQLKSAGLEAAAVGERDLALGVDALKQLGEQSGLPLLAANLVDRAGRPVFRPGVILDRPGLRIGVVGIAPPLGERARARVVYERAGLRQLPAKEALKAAADRLVAEGAELVIALVNAGRRETAELLQALPSGAVRVGIAGGGVARPKPRIVQGRIVVAGTGGQGRAVLQLRLDNPKGQKVALAASLSQLAEQERSLEQRAQAWGKRGGEDGKRTQAALQVELERTRARRAKLSGPQTMRVELALQRLPIDQVEDPAAAAAVAAWREANPQAGGAAELQCALPAAGGRAGALDEASR